MRKSILLFLFVLALAPFSSAHACSVDLFASDPGTIYSDTRFAELVLSGVCGSSDTPLLRNVTVDGSLITVEFQFSGGGLAVITSWTSRVPLPMLRAGTYSVRLTGGPSGADMFEERTLIVHERVVRVTPAVGGEFTDVIIEGYERPACNAVPCAEIEVFFGNTKATNVRFSARSELLATVPAGTGLVDVRIVTGSQTVTIEDAFRYGTLFDDDVEWVLFPVNFMARGAFGSDWRSDIVVRNDGPVTIETRPLFWANPTIPTLPIPEPIAPGGKGNFPQLERDGGQFLYVPRGLEEKLSYASHVVDRSRSESDLGTELPVVRAEDTDSVVKLLQVPVGELYRAKLRVYDVAANRSVLVRFTDPAGRESLTVVGLALTGIPVCPIAPCVADRPAFGVLDLETIPGLQSGNFPNGVDVTITSVGDGGRLWGFVTVTNNDTQHVTVYTPQHRRRAQ
ncbi:MAG TPA: hypothetical protein VE974_13335 [Thermoanaerobaculia bacterium]|nr:hypothetical protein [Thermoanaerobaculia bacterium]